VTAFINVCEHPEPVAELRRVYDAISQTLGFRTLEQFAGTDVWQLRVILHALGYYRPGVATLTRDSASTLYTPELVAAVDAFRAAERLATPALGSPPGLVDAETVARLWGALERAGKAQRVREQLLDATAVRR
jgi:peptidoglycan hydrolase-like protein with peptidoglycan-binding domain